MSYEQIKKLRSVDFIRYCGVKHHTFQKMVEVYSAHLAKSRIKAGRPPKLAVEDQILMTLEYWREYRTYFHIAKSWGARRIKCFAHQPTGRRCSIEKQSIPVAGQEEVASG
jgi:hypothetical protein